MDRNNTGVSFLGILQIVFIALKVTNVIDWSWWQVFIPLWINLSLAFIIITIVLIAYIVQDVLEILKKKK